MIPTASYAQREDNYGYVHLTKPPQKKTGFFKSLFNK